MCITLSQNNNYLCDKNFKTNNYEKLFFGTDDLDRFPYDFL